RQETAAFRKFAVSYPLARHYPSLPVASSHACGQSHQQGIHNVVGIKTHHDAELVSTITFDTEFDQLYDCRPFDVQHINYDLSKVERHCFEVMKHFIGHENYGLVIDRQVVTDNWSHIQIVRNMIDNRVHYSRKSIPIECPMFLYDENEKCNC
ncbi:MAG: type ISP restriction/modification enzyme, partial [Cloacibacillus sp.]